MVSCTAFGASARSISFLSASAGCGKNALAPSMEAVAMRGMVRDDRMLFMVSSGLGLHAFRVASVSQPDTAR
jgi:hypothetical protein